MRCPCMYPEIKDKNCPVPALTVINTHQPSLFHAIRKVLPRGWNPLVSGITQIFSMNFQKAGTQYKREEQIPHFDLIFIHLLARAVCDMRLFLILGANSEIVQSLQPMSGWCYYSIFHPSFNFNEDSKATGLELTWSRHLFLWLKRNRYHALIPAWMPDKKSLKV